MTRRRTAGLALLLVLGAAASARGQDGAGGDAHEHGPPPPVWPVETQLGAPLRAAVIGARTGRDGEPGARDDGGAAARPPADAAITTAADTATDRAALPRVLDAQLARLRELTLLLRGARPDLFADDPADRTRGNLAADGALQLLSRQLGEELALLERTVLVLADGDARPPDGAWVSSVTRRVRGPEEGYLVELAPDAPVRELSLEIANVGRVTARAPRLEVNGRAPWRDGDELLAAALGGATEPSEQAQRLWRFVVQHRRHGQPAHTGAPCHDPVKLLSVWGYGFCDDAANALANLARAAGLQARVWGLQGHVVPELFHDGRWHVYDPDHEAYWLAPEGHVASVDELAADPSLLARPVHAPGSRGSLPLQRLQEVYASREDNALASYPPLAAFADLRYELRPGERVVFHCGHEGARFASDGFLRMPPVLGNGRWIHDVPLEPGAPLPLQLDYALPYPILDGSVQLAPLDPSAGAAALLVHASTAQQDWTELPLAATADGWLVAALGGLLARGSGDPDERVSVRVSLREGVPPSAAAAARPAHAHVELLFQHAPDALPALAPGRNEVVFRCDSPGTVLEVVHRYHQP